MATQLQIRRGTAAQVAAFTGAEGEIVYNSTNDSLHTNDGATAGGFELARADLNNVSDANLNAALTGNTVSALTINTLTATGGTINGTVIGGTTAAAGSFTTGTFSSTLGVTGAATFSGFVSAGRTTITDTSLPLVLNNVVAGQALEIGFQDAGAYKWGIDKLPDNSFGIYNFARGGYDLSLNAAGAATFTGEITANGGIALGDNDKATFGASDDLQIYHDGSNSYIDDAGTGNLRIRGSQVILEKYTGETILQGIADGSVYIFHDNALKLATTATGIDVTGSVVADGLTVNSGTSNVAATFASTDTYALIQFEDSATTTETTLGAYANDMVFRVGASERLRIDSSGNVGIGTSNPANKFVVAEGTNQHGLELVPGSLSYIQAYDRDTSDYGDLKIDAQTIAFGTDNGSERMRIDSSGNAIFTKAGGAYLQLKDASAVRGAINVTTSDGLIFTTGASFTERMRIDSAGNLSLYQNQELRWQWQPNDYIRGAMSVDGSSNMTFTTAYVERMRIDSSGNITQTGSSSADFLIKAPTDNASLTLQAGASDTGAEGAFVNFLQNTTYKWQMGMNTDNSFRWYNYATSSEAMRIDSSGNVGIGTSSPSRRLHVKDSGSFVATFEGATNAYTSWSNSTGTAGYIGSANGLGSGGLTDLAVRSENNLIFLTNAGSEKVRIDSSGNLLVNGTATPTWAGTGPGVSLQGNYPVIGWEPANGDKHIIYAQGDGSFVFYNTTDSRADGFIDGTGVLHWQSQYSNTTANAANCWVGTSGYIYRSTSSIKYKRDVETMEDSYADAILDVRPVFYRSKSDEDNQAHGFWGIIAEELADIDPRLVHWTVDKRVIDTPAVYEDIDGVETLVEPETYKQVLLDAPEPEGVQYERFVPHLINLARRQRDQIIAQTSAIEALTARIEALEGA